MLGKKMEDLIAEMSAGIPGLEEELRRKLDASGLAGESRATPLALGGRSTARTTRTTRTISRQPGVPVEPIEARRLEVVPERIVLKGAGIRPVARISQDQVSAGFIGPDSPAWRNKIRENRETLNQWIPSVGMLEISHVDDDDRIAGTGWVIAPGIVVTNRHVAEQFAQRDPATSEGVFRIGRTAHLMAVHVDFLEEEDNQASADFSVPQVLWIASPEEADVAFLQIIAPPGRSLPAPVPLAPGEPEANTLVAAIGYPSRDPFARDQALVISIFGNGVYDKKRLAPGRVLAVDATTVQHDCSTLGGNSGSLLLDMENGYAVGLHHGGFLDDSANLAVSSSHLRKLLRQVLALEPQAPFAPRRGSPLNLDSALGLAQRTLQDDPNVLAIRTGYRFQRGWITDERVIVVEVREKLGEGELLARGWAPFPTHIGAWPIDVRSASLPARLRSLGVNPEEVQERRARPGKYQEPEGFAQEGSDYFLGRIQEPMSAVFHIGPQQGFAQLKPFIERTTQRLTATMYEWEAENHISQAIATTIGATEHRRLKMVTQRRGVRDTDATESAVLDMQSRLTTQFDHVWAAVRGPAKLFPSSYHIKVAVRDGEEVWLSSGNWKSSGQPELPGKNVGPGSNREWHAVISNKRLASLFEAYIDYDFEQAGRAVDTEARWAPADTSLAFFVPDAPFVNEGRRLGSRSYATSLRIDNELLDIQPLLTPDRDARLDPQFLTVATEMVRRATTSVHIQNQSFNLTDTNNEEFDAFFEAVRDQQQRIPVRIILRDAREFPGDAMEGQQRLIERLKDFGIDTSPNRLRLQMGCHTKGIIVDAKEVLLGSHNFTNQGALYNRDASLLVRSPKVARFFETIFLQDWDDLAHNDASERVDGMRLARPGEPTPPGFRKVTWAELFSDS